MNWTIIVKNIPLVPDSTPTELRFFSAYIYYRDSAPTELFAFSLVGIFESINALTELLDDLLAVS